MAAEHSATCGGCAALLQRLRALEARVSALSGESRAERDRARLAVLLPAIAEVLDDRNFTTAELLTIYRRRSVRLDRALHDQRIDSGRELGQLFARGAGQRIKDMVLTQCSEFGRQRSGNVWAVCIAERQYTSNSTNEEGCG